MYQGRPPLREQERAGESCAGGVHCPARGSSISTDIPNLNDQSFSAGVIALLESSSWLYYASQLIGATVLDIGLRISKLFTLNRLEIERGLTGYWCRC